MKLNIELDQTKISQFKKIIMHLKKTCPNQTIYITFDSQSIKLITDYNSSNLQHIHAFYNLGMLYYVNHEKMSIESKKQDNLIQLKIKEFSSLANNLSQVQDQATSVSLILSKEHDQRYLKIKAQENQALQTISKSEIFLHFNELEFPRIDDKLFQLSIPSKDICKMLDISHKKEQDVFLLVQANNQEAELTIQLNNPSITVTYSNIPVKEWSPEYLQTQQDYTKEFRICYQHSRQLSQICAINEDLQFGILSNDQSISIEFQELNQDGTIIGIKTYVIPKIENWDEDQKMEEEYEVKQEDMQDAQSSIQQQLRDKVDQLDDSDDN